MLTAISPLFDHQDRAVDFILKNHGIGALYMDMGTGKTRTALEAFTRLRETNPGLKMIVIAPLSLLEAAWGEDIQKFTDLTYYNAHDNLVPDYLKDDILLINFEGVIQKKNSHITKHLLNNFLVIDESSKMKSHNSKTTKTVLSFKNLPKYKVIMSGTPAPNSPLEYWAQMEFLQDWTLHKSFFAFRNSYFHLQRGSQSMQLQPGQLVSRQLMREIMTKGWKYEITPINLKKMMDRINPLIFWAKKEECLTLPEQVDEIRSIELSADQKRIYKEMKNDLITEIKNTPITAQVALAKLAKLREICSGFAFDSTGNIHEIGENPKLQELQDTLEEIGRKQVIIWCQFHYEVEKIASVLNNFVTLYGKTKDKNDSINRFKSGEAQYLLAHPRSAAHGLTFVGCNQQIFFSLDYSAEMYEQAKARTHRAGQTQSCTYIHLIAKDTIDETILKVVKDKVNLEEEIYGLLSN